MRLFCSSRESAHRSCLVLVARGKTTVFGEVIGRITLTGCPFLRTTQ
ncbi:hypothetical protein PspLS_10901 [Pyricularia sp. CBS 133598]|nr:hypothetical protein PspLS_10901 [Pyricularia sp. CBS 133598]